MQPHVTSLLVQSYTVWVLSRHLVHIDGKTSYMKGWRERTYRGMALVCTETLRCAFKKVPSEKMDDLSSALQ
eukprot:1653070-Amphidinium_carterae.1